MKNTVYFSPFHDPALNLAAEEWMSDRVEKDEVIFYLWQNQNTVVIGRNQNPYKECDLQAIERDGNTLIRRRSGGGAVFHDLGNLNFTFVADDRYDLELNLKVILDALKEFGLDAEFSGRNDILLDGKKFSGNAFSSKGTKKTHHGTILYNVDMSRLSNYLKVPKLKMEAKGIKSVVSRVTNLIEAAPEMTIESLEEALVRSFEANFGPIDEVREITKADFEDLPTTLKYKEWAWNIGHSPVFNIHLEERFKWGILDIYLDIKSGMIDKANVYSDTILEDNFSDFIKALQRQPFTKGVLLAATDELSESIRDEVRVWLESQELA